MSNSDNIRRAVTKLGFFTGDIGEHQFVARLLNLASTGNSIDPSSTVDAFDAMDGNVDTSPGSDLEKLLSSLIGLTDGGTFTSNFIQDVKDFCEVGPDEPAPPERLVASMRDPGENLLFTVTAEETFSETTLGFLNNTKMSELLGVDDINSSFDAPTKETPNIAAYQFHNPALNFANRSSGLCGVFLNLLPTIEISKCQPFVDIKLITKTKAVENVGGENRIGDGISLLRFLYGKSVVDDGEIGVSETWSAICGVCR